MTRSAKKICGEENLKGTVASSRAVAETQRRIDLQTILVATLRPGSEPHRLATDILLTLADSMHLLIESQRLLVKIEAQNKLRLLLGPLTVLDADPSAGLSSDRRISLDRDVD